MTSPPLVEPERRPQGDGRVETNRSEETHPATATGAWSSQRVRHVGLDASFAQGLTSGSTTGSKP